MIVMSEFIPCKHLDHQKSNYPSCELVENDQFLPEITYWKRKPMYDGAAEKVQFCGKGKGRINNIFECYDTCTSCHELTR
jgi:hypothetical protein